MKAATARRVSRWVLLGALLSILGYLVGANLFLRFGLPLAFRSTNSLNATVRRAWTIWPGVVHVRDARIVFQDYNLQWSLDLERATVTLSLHELASRTFHATKVTGSGVVFRMRHRIDPWKRWEPWVSTLAPIPEFPTPAVFEARVPEAPLTEETYNLWTVQLENVDVQAREIWVHFVRLRGEARARGAFRLRPARRLWVGPASLTIERSLVTLGQDQLVQNLTGRVSCVVHPFDVRIPNGREVLRFISSELELRGNGATPDPVVRQFFAASGLALHTQPGNLRLSANVRHGKLSESSSFELESPAVRGSLRDLTLDAADVSLSARIEGERVQTKLGFRRGALTSSQLATAPSRIEGAVISAVTSGVDTAGDAAVIARRLRLERLKLADARLLNRFTDDKLRFSSGKAELELDIGDAEDASHAAVSGDLDEIRLQARATTASFSGSLSARGERQAAGRAHGRLELERAKATLSSAGAAPSRDLARFDGLNLQATFDRDAHGRIDADLSAASAKAGARLGATWLDARGHLSLRVSDFEPRSLRGEARAELVLERGSAVSTRGRECPWGRLPRAHVRAQMSSSGQSAAASLQAELTDAWLSWGDFHATGAVDLSAQLDVKNIAARQGRVELETRARDVSLQSGTGSERGWETLIPDFRIAAAVVADRTLSGTLKLSAPNNQTRIGRTRFRTDFGGEASLLSLDLERREADFSSHFSISNAHFSLGEQQLDGWWATIQTGAGLLVARDNLDLALPFSAQLRDGEPGMAMLAESGRIPGVIADALPLRSIAVTGTLERRCRLTRFSFARATGGPLFGRGVLNSTPEDVRGAFLLGLEDLHAIAVGVLLDSRESGQGGISLFAGNDWLRERAQSLDDEAERALPDPCPTPPSECGAEAREDPLR